MVMQLKVEDRLQGAQNFPTWKERITRILDVNDVEEHIDSKKFFAHRSDRVDEMQEVRFQSYVDHFGRGEGPHSPSPFQEEDRIRDVEGFEKSVPKQEQEPKDGVAREDVQHQNGQGKRSGVLSHKAHTDQG